MLISEATYKYVLKQRDNYHFEILRLKKQLEDYNLQKEIGEWSIATFGNKQSLEGLENHLKKELAELLSAPNFACKIEEASDLLILLFGIAHRRKYNAIEEARRKFEVVKKRKWGHPDIDGVISHVD